MSFTKKVTYSVQTLARRRILPSRGLLHPLHSMIAFLLLNIHQNIDSILALSFALSNIHHELSGDIKNQLLSSMRSLFDHSQSRLAAVKITHNLDVQRLKDPQVNA